MSQLDDTKDLPEGSTADVRLFPLPNLVLFPHALQPLHIHEPRYNRLLEDSLDDDGLIAAALFEAGWEQDYDGRAAIASVVCVGRVVSHAEESQGRHNILLMGIRRAQIRRELATNRPYREAEVRMLGDYVPAADAQPRQRLRGKLVDSFRSYLPTTVAVQQQFEQLLSSHVPLGVLTDIVAFTIKLEVQVKQQLLQQLNVDRRAELLLTQLEQSPPQRHDSLRYFPPEFSLN